MAAEGFDRLSALMRKSSGRGNTALERLQLCGGGYVDFALHWPQHFLVMFDRPTTSHQPCNHEPLGRNAFDVLVGCIMAAQHSGDLPPGDPLPQAWIAWSLVHGVAKLAVSGNLPLSHRATLAFTRRATEALLGGLGNVKAER